MTTYEGGRRSGRAAPRRRFLFIVTLAALLAPVVFGGCSFDFGGGAGDGGGGGSTAQTAPNGTLEVRIATSPEKLTLLEDLAEQFNAKKQRFGDKPAFVVVQKTSSGIGAELLIDDWPESAEQRRPTVWTPSASLWGTYVNERRLQEGKPQIVDSFKSLMLTPAVIAMPQPMAEALGYPQNPVGWADVAALAKDPAGWGRFGHPEWGAFRLGKTDPNISTSGFTSTIAQSYAGVGKQRELTAADVTSPQNIAFLEGIESSIVHYGDTTLTFLNNLANADERGAGLRYISAVTVEEKSVIDYNRGDPDGILQPGETLRPPRVPLVAIYPKEGTLWSDNPMYVLDAPWVSKDQKAAAAAFIDFALEPAAQKEVLAAGFRPSDPSIPLGAPIDAANGLDPAQPQTVLPVPPGPALLQVLDTWDATRKAARVLMVIDVSGSMSERAAPDGATKLDLAKQAVIESLDAFSDRDEVALWVFSTQLDGETDHLELAPLEPIATNRDRLKQLVGGLVPGGGTGLYDTTAASVAAMEDVAAPDRITAVMLLTDGRNEDRFSPYRSTDDVVAEIGRQRELGTVRVFAVAYGEDPSIPELTSIVQATNGALYQSKDPKDIRQVLRNVISNF
jgi:Ca-activated chloride channel family protein